jgi:hypothetical protein
MVLLTLNVRQRIEGDMIFSNRDDLEVASKGIGRKAGLDVEDSNMLEVSA